MFYMELIGLLNHIRRNLLNIVYLYFEMSYDYLIVINQLLRFVFHIEAQIPRVKPKG